MLTAGLLEGSDVNSFYPTSSFTYFVQMQSFLSINYNLFTCLILLIAVTPTWR